MAELLPARELVLVAAVETPVSRFGSPALMRVASEGNSLHTPYVASSGCRCHASLRMHMAVGSLQVNSLVLSEQVCVVSECNV